MNFKTLISVAIKYSGFTFGVGFLLGTIRVLFLIPRLGETLSVVIELPIILTISWKVFRHLIKNLKDSFKFIDCLFLSFISLLLLLSFEIMMSVLIFQGNINNFFERILTLQGAIGFFGQVIFSFIPTLILIKDSKCNSF